MQEIQSNAHSSQAQHAQDDYFKGRGAQLNTPNPYLKQSYVQEHFEGLDEPLLSHQKTELRFETLKTWWECVTFHYCMSYQLQVFTVSLDS
ncbi:MAG: hypothetical protein AAF570_24380 [Bacteroidota bacterium]